MAELTLDALHRLIVEILVAHDTSASVAEQVAAALTLAEADGQKGHGASRVPSYAGQAKSGKVDGHAVPELIRLSDTAFMIDAKSGFAYPALAMAQDLLVEAVKAGTFHVVTVEALEPALALLTGRDPSEVLAAADAKLLDYAKAARSFAAR